MFVLYNSKTTSLLHIQQYLGLHYINKDIKKIEIKFHD